MEQNRYIDVTIPRSPLTNVALQEKDVWSLSYKSLSVFIFYAVTRKVFKMFQLNLSIIVVYSRQVYNAASTWAREQLRSTNCKASYQYRQPLAARFFDKHRFRDPYHHGGKVFCTWWGDRKNISTVTRLEKKLLRQDVDVENFSSTDILLRDFWGSFFPK